MKTLAVIFALVVGSCAAADVASVEGEWRQTVTEDSVWKLFAMANPQAAKTLTDAEKKQMIALGISLNKASCWTFKKDGSFEFTFTASQQLKDDIKAAQSKMDQTPELKANLERWEKFKTDVPEVQISGKWKLNENKLTLEMKAPDEKNTIAPMTGTISDDGITLDDGGKLVRKK